CDRAHERGMKIILDGVFSHTGSNSRYFDARGVFGHGAVSDPDSPYRSWFDFQRWPDIYTSWWGIDTLPCVNELDDGFLDFVVRNEDSVIAHWLRAGADGFRLDVADELPDRFIALLRERMKSVKPDSLLIGEVWEDASNKVSYGVRRRYFVDGELDSVMNYPFRNAVLGLVLGTLSPRGFSEAVMEICENYPAEVLDTLMNMISTHDTPRALSLLSPEPPPAEKRARAGYRMPRSALDTAIRRLRCAAFVQFVLPGMPCIYYGDEIGMQGLEDPFCRGFFEWESVPQNALLDFFCSLGALRNSLPELKRGKLAASSDDLVLSLERVFEDKRLLARINAGEKIALEKKGEIIFSDGCVSEEGALRFEALGFSLERLS
ncbi:MAG: glycoside hydrolase family 13 protein, partial [Clostridia bacterium]|nr:glycoside hydrolase family 13 protein [Clostridia bacterium]